MEPIIIANVEEVENVPFLVAVLFGDDGYLADEIAVPYESTDQAVEKVVGARESHGYRSAEVWTSSEEIFAEMLNVPGLAAQIKHESDTRETWQVVDKYRDILMEFHNIPPAVPKLKPSRWRVLLIAGVRKILNLLEGDGKYEV